MTFLEAREKHAPSAEFSSGSKNHATLGLSSSRFGLLTSGVLVKVRDSVKRSVLMSEKIVKGIMVIIIK